jgi:hypothetical protein
MPAPGLAPAHPLGYGSVWSVPIDVPARQLTLQHGLYRQNVPSVDRRPTMTVNTLRSKWQIDRTLGRMRRSEQCGHWRSVPFLDGRAAPGLAPGCCWSGGDGPLCTRRAMVDSGCMAQRLVHRRSNQLLRQNSPMNASMAARPMRLECEAKPAAASHIYPIGLIHCRCRIRKCRDGHPGGPWGSPPDDLRPMAGSIRPAISSASFRSWKRRA